MNLIDKDRGVTVRKNIKKAIIEYIEEHGYSPSVREIGDMVGLKSSSSIHSHLKIMLIQGAIETDADIGTPRAIRVPGYKFVETGQHKPKTNGDVIRAMSDEKLAEFIANECLQISDKICGECKQQDYSRCGGYVCVEYLIKWLKSEAR